MNHSALSNTKKRDIKKLRIKSLANIIKTMEKYRDKPSTEPLSLAEDMLCLVAYFEQFK